jgi:hypothetical protein
MIKAPDFCWEFMGIDCILRDRSANLSDLTAVRVAHTWPLFALCVIFGRIHRKMRDVCATHGTVSLKLVSLKPKSQTNLGADLLRAGVLI